MSTDNTAARIAAASMPTPEQQVAALRDIDRTNEDWDADRYPYYLDASGDLWKDVLRKDYVRKAHSAVRYGDSEMSFRFVNSLYGPLVRVDA
ncbi:hypothetical protein ABZ234_03945 [Nocardiopsis sp. NPDC006198]|uniref:hypothetical protein n=1 Tax=Nocardiopsis sp. NPDC006198 TaxID=3154472 RepID=UPI0033A059C2